MVNDMTRKKTSGEKLSDVFSIQGLQFVGFLTNLQLL